MSNSAIHLRRGLTAAAAAYFLSSEGAEGSDAWLASLGEIEDVYVGVPKLFFESDPVHPGCANALNYILNIFDLPADALDIASLIGTTLTPCVPNNPVTFSSDSDESSALEIEYRPVEWTQEDEDLVHNVASQLSTLWDEVVREVDEEFKPRDALGIVRHPYANVDRGLAAIKKLFAKASSSPDLSRFLAMLLPDSGNASGQPTTFGVVSMVRFCITNVPDVLVGLLSSKTVGNILVHLIPALEIKDGAGLSMTIAGSFSDMDLGSILCGGIDFSIDGKDFDPQWVVCGLANALGAIMSCRASSLDCATIKETVNSPPEIAPACDKRTTDGVMPHPGAATDAPADVDLTLQPASTFYDENGNVNQTTIGNEGYIYFYDFRSTTFQAQFTSQSGCDVDRVLDQFIPGWNRTAEIFLNQPASTMQQEINKDYLAFATISRRGGNLCEWHIAQRGTFNQFEWVKNFQAELRPVPYEGLEDASWHRGYADLVAVVAPMFDDYFGKYIGEGKECSYGESKIHMAGHSLGGGMIEAYALHFAAVWQPLGVTIESVSIAPARALNPAAMEFVTSRVNMRSIVNQLDMIPRFPCANKHGLPRCDPRKCFTWNGEGWDSTYAAHPNELEIGFSELEAINATKFAHLDLAVDITATLSMDITLAVSAMPSHLDFSLQHVDAYNCWFTKEFCNEDETVVVSACA